MNSPAITATPQFSGAKEYPARLLGNDRAELAEEPRSPNRAARGAITGILLGAGLWTAILASFGVIKF